MVVYPLVSRRLVLALSFASLFPISYAFAEEGITPPPAGAAPVAAAPVSFDQTLNEVDRLDADLRKKAEDLRTQLSTETAAHRVSEPIAESLRWNLENFATSGGDFSAAFKADRLPTENAQLMASFNALAADCTEAKKKYEDLLTAAITAGQNELSASLHSIKTMEDLAPLARNMDRLNDGVRKHQTVFRDYNGVPVRCFNLIGYFGYFRRVVGMGENPDPIDLNRVLMEFQTNRGGVLFINEGDILARVKIALAPFADAEESTQEALDKALVENRPAAELDTKLTQFEDAVRRHQEARSGLNFRLIHETNTIMDIYRNLVALTKAIAADDAGSAWSTWHTLRESKLEVLGPKDAKFYDSRLNDLAEAMEEKHRLAEKQRQEAFRTRLDAIKTPTELDSFASEISRHHRARIEPDDESPLQGAAIHLHALAAAWANDSISLLRMDDGRLPDTIVAPEVAALRERIEREIITRILPAPELKEPALASLPAKTALDQFADQLATKGEWRRLLALTEYRNSAIRNGGNGEVSTDLAASIRAYIGGQNLEMAELWMEAIRAYKTVLRGTDSHAPVKEAAERIKTLAKSHPDAFVAESPTPGASPVPQPNPLLR